ncbi:MFS transporter [Rhizobiaceae bacterium BDR2-2]|uniref:MFS transporter n=1 Tax=Ectorhizobium quercum TaxID=2965071 RepID=A0AAE3N2I0_9HYPH|nr:MFS transporter [Ectorhizobium quercum]MCX8998991.1 MFS transporter [Ectorhizobium quercum]
MSSIRPLVPLLATAGMLIGGNGLQGTYIALRGGAEGFGPSVIGVIGAGYSIGFAVGCIYVARILRSIGHIRTFAAMAAITAAASLAMSMIIEPPFWFAMRFVIGICVASLFATIESWINARVTNANRARTLSVYRLVDLFSVTAVQYLVPAFGVEGPTIFSLICIAITLSIVPIAMADRSSPAVPEAIRFELKTVWTISPLAVVGVVAVGLSMAAFRNIGPIYASEIGMSITGIANFMSAGIVGGVVLQYPLGLYSDRLDRRIVILLTTIGAAAASLFLAFFAGGDAWMNIVGVFLFGAFALPLYSLCSAHGNDFARDGQHALVSAGLLFYWSIGATAGPFLASVLLDLFGPRSFFIYTAVIQIAFTAYTVRRMAARPGIPAGQRRRRFRALLRTSIWFNRLAAPPGEDKESR